jgi:CopG family nickel-responsive transcriptional regulator
LSDIIRFGVSIEQDLLENYDRLISERGYAARSEALRDLIREALIQQRIEIKSETLILGSLTLVYDHHAGNLIQEMTHIQHDFHQLILSVMHLHVSHNVSNYVGYVQNGMDFFNGHLHVEAGLRWDYFSFDVDGFELSDAETILKGKESAARLQPKLAVAWSPFEKFPL